MGMTGFNYHDPNTYNYMNMGYFPQYNSTTNTSNKNGTVNSNPNNDPNCINIFNPSNVSNDVL